MKRTTHTLLHALGIVVLATTLIAFCGPNSAAVAEETKKEAQTSETAKIHHGDQKHDEGSLIKPRKASCSCGKLTVTYEGPDPERITLCHCNSCQMRTGSMWSVQARFPREKVKIVGKSTEWTFPNKEGERVTESTCDSGGATYHFCPVCGSTVYWDFAALEDFVGIAIGTLTDPTFPAPKISGFEAYGHPWAMNAEGLDIIRLEIAE